MSKTLLSYGKNSKNFGSTGGIKPFKMRGKKFRVGSYTSRNFRSKDRTLQTGESYVKSLKMNTPEPQSEIYQNTENSSKIHHPVTETTKHTDRSNKGYITDGKKYINMS